MSQAYYTLGYQHKKIDQFIEILKRAKVNTLYDIRSFPQGKWPSPFNSDALNESLRKAGIRYKWEPKLGGKIKHSKAVRRRHMPGPSDGNVAFMCMEENIADCHRKEIAALAVEMYRTDVVDLTTIIDPVTAPVQQALL